MSPERFSSSPEQDATQSKVTAIASALHEDWRKTRLNQDGTFEPRVKATKDEGWIATHGTDQVDIANTQFVDLPSDWQAENQAAAEVVVGILDTTDTIDINDPVQRSAVGNQIHDAWLSRNNWAKDGELGVPFDQLPPAEQSKDIDQLVIAQQTLQQ